MAAFYPFVLNFSVAFGRGGKYRVKTPASFVNGEDFVADGRSDPEIAVFIKLNIIGSS